jgi:DNA modification methylase
MKPVELVERALQNSSQADDIVLDLFAGAGSTLIACERYKRRARLMEIDPRYCDVIVRRWQDYSGLRATLEGDGRAFQEVADVRRDATAENHTD